MKRQHFLYYLTTAVVIIITICLYACKADGLHPNLKAWYLIVPILYAYAWAKTQMLNSGNTLANQIKKQLIK